MRHAEAVAQAFRFDRGTYRERTSTGGRNAALAGMRHLVVTRGRSSLAADSGDIAVRSIHSCSALPCRGIATFLRIVGKFSFQLRTRAIETAHHRTDFHTLFVSYLLV